MTNKEIAEAIIKGKRQFYRVTDFKRATAIRVAGHRLGAVLTAQSVKKGWKLVKSSARVRHQPKAAKRRAKGRKS